MANENETFDPADHTVQEVLDYLDDQDATEVARVLEAERAGKDRKGILVGVQGVVPEPDEDGYTRIIISS